jgi:nicotinamide-nucleotide amidase
MFEFDGLFELTENLKKSNLTIAVAESCTGGLLSSALTSLPGSSKYFKEGIVTYTIESKNKRLNLDKNIIDNYGVISEETAKAMAIKIKEYLNNDIGISITGNAGPDVNQENTPVGLVYIAIATNNNVKSFANIFNGNRDEIRYQSVQKAILLLRTEVLSNNK